MRNVPRSKHEHLLIQQDFHFLHPAWCFCLHCFLSDVWKVHITTSKNIYFLISLLESCTYNKAVIWQQIPAAVKGSLQRDRFRSVSLTNIQTDVASLRITDVKFPSREDRGKEDSSYWIILPIHWPVPGRILNQMLWKKDVKYLHSLWAEHGSESQMFSFLPWIMD